MLESAAGNRRAWVPLWRFSSEHTRHGGGVTTHFVVGGAWSGHGGVLHLSELLRNGTARGDLGQEIRLYYKATTLLVIELLGHLMHSTRGKHHSLTRGLIARLFIKRILAHHHGLRSDHHVVLAVVLLQSTGVAVMMLMIEAVARAPVLLEHNVRFGFWSRRYHSLELNRGRGVTHQKIVPTVRSFAREKHPARPNY